MGRDYAITMTIALSVIQRESSIMDAETMPFKTPCHNSVNNYMLLNSDGSLMVKCGELHSYGVRCNHAWRVWFRGDRWIVEDVERSVN